MIANTRPLHYVPHAGAAMPWQGHQLIHTESSHGVADADKHGFSAIPAGVVSADQTLLLDSIALLPLSDYRAPGIVLIASRPKPKELMMPATNSLSSNNVQPSFSEQLFLLLMLV